MSAEKEPQKNFELTDKERTFLETVFRSEKIYGDAFNELLPALNILALVRRSDEEAITSYLQKVKKTRHYLQRIQEHEPPSQYEYIKSHSDPEIVRRFDEIVDIINNEAEAILKNRDEKRANELADLFRNLRKDVNK